MCNWGWICVQAHAAIVGGIQVTADCWLEALGDLLAVGQSSSSLFLETWAFPWGNSEFDNFLHLIKRVENAGKSEVKSFVT